MKHDGLFAIFDENRAKLLRYFRAHGAGDAAEDCLQELWLRVSSAATGPVASPLSYLFRAATNLMIDRHRAETQSRRRDHDWSELAGRQADSEAHEPSAEQRIAARQQLALVARELESLPPRAVAILKRHRIDGLTQREIAAEMGLSASTIESDLRLSYRVLTDLRERLDEE
jgi:RNA polymerase sigma-70 factor (ECF subfamily)